MRLLLVAAWAVALFLLLRPFVRHWLRMRRPPYPPREALIKDPVCQTYFPQSRAVTRTIGGTVHYFCSEKCAAEFPGRGVAAGDS